MKDLLNEGGASRDDTAQNTVSIDSAFASRGDVTLFDGNDTSVRPLELSDSIGNDVFELFCHETLEPPRDIASGNFSDALSSLQDGMALVLAVLSHANASQCSATGGPTPSRALETDFNIMSQADRRKWLVRLCNKIYPCHRVQ